MQKNDLFDLRKFKIRETLFTFNLTNFIKAVN